MDKYTIYCTELRGSAQNLNGNIGTLQEKADKLQKAINKVTRGDYKASDLSSAYTAQTALAGNITRLGEICSAMNTAALQFSEASAELSGRADLTAYYMQHTDTLSYEELMGTYTAAIASAGSAVAGYELIKDKLSSNGYSVSGLDSGSNAMQDAEEEKVGIFSTGKKIFKTATTVAKGALAVIGCAASWVAPSPLTILSTVYAVNTVSSCFSDIGNLWWGDESKVGEVNFLKDTAAGLTGDIAESLGGSREVGEFIGKCVYGAGELVVNIGNARNIASVLKGETNTVSFVNEIKENILSKSHLTLKGKIIQNDTSFKTVVEAVKEIPTAVSGLKDIAFNSPLSAIAYDYKLLSYQISNLEGVAGMVKVLKEVADVTSDVTSNVIELVMPT